MRLVHGVLFGITSILFAGCLAADDVGEVGEPDDGLAAAAITLAVTTTEGFESGSKSEYAASEVTLASGTWNFEDALIGGLAGDVKDGAHAARVRNAGCATMIFDRAGGADTVTIVHAVYGSDASASWALYE